ncbi:uncharacterized protein N7479_008291 [Penicillium vulpinum]|uniref:SnoaL-like domain-containing protein n=1 Tax=Penicillium vulpinum TaxID=29845 RepID=A0A1V6RJL5_9EURO|nr:uncharacterized protein N7479_008291 [Penicillium vulpinum]KAJ5961141.1 hypothetical protein N7479_008291 [Penicillium vulpinum]OQE01619.1 hypothetical protein PENVUL_c042G04034 [Penicillium vulpinum]
MATSNHELIRNTIARWPLIMDQKNSDLLSKTFTPDAVFHYPPPIGTIQGTIGIVEMLQTLKDVTTYHSLGTQIIELTSATTATATTYCIGIHVRTGDRAGESITILGYYEDRLVKGKVAEIGQDDDVWRIFERRVHHHIPSTGGQKFPALA